MHCWRKVLRVIEKVTLLNILFHLAQTSSQKGTFFVQDENKMSHHLYESSSCLKSMLGDIWVAQWVKKHIEMYSSLGGVKYLEFQDLMIIMSYYM